MLTMEATEEALRAESRQRALTHLNILLLASVVLLANVLLVGPAIAQFILDRSGGPPSVPTAAAPQAPPIHPHAG
jgi:hypothetical protein